MWNPFTCMWAVVHFALVEHLLLESKHKTNIIELVRFIDEMFIIWKKNKRQPNKWRDFKMCLNQASNLNWVYEDLRVRVVFLDLEIWNDRKDKKFTHKPYTKEISLLLHLPPHSAHTKEVWKGMIHGLLRKHWRHCCKIEDHIVEVEQSHKGMINRRYFPVN